MTELIEMTALECICGGIVSVANDIDNDFVECDHCDNGYPIDYWREEQSDRELIEIIDNMLENAK